MGVTSGMSIATPTLSHFLMKFIALFSNADSAIKSHDSYALESREPTVCAHVVRMLLELCEVLFQG